MSDPRLLDPEWFHAMVEAASEFAILSLDTEGNVTTWNSGAERMFNYTPAEMLGKPSSAIFTPEDQIKGEDERELRIAATEGCADDNRWHVRKDGTRVWGSGRLMAMRDGSGIVRGFVKVIQDRSDERRMEESLRTSEEQFARVFLGNPAAMVVQRLDTGNFVLANEAFFELTGYWRSEVMGRNAEALELWANPQDWQEAVRGLNDSYDRMNLHMDVRRKSREVSRCLVALASTQMESFACAIATFVPVPPKTLVSD